MNMEQQTVAVTKKFQPWGQMRRSQLDLIIPPRVPTDFRLRVSEDPKDREGVWTGWRTATLGEIKEILWPEYKPESQEWEGASIAMMEPLTIADHEVMAKIQSDQGGLEFERPVRSPVRSAAAPIQRDLFVLEDKERFGEAYSHYDKTLPQELSVETINGLRNQAMLSKVSSVSSQFKFFLQRPRPYQTAVTLQRADFKYLFAESADTPSMCSGHCLQGILAVGGILERILTDNAFEQVRASPHSLTALCQWAVDLGDRRVMAGVHYPSDNLASWLIFLRLADRVYFHQDVKLMLWNAIKSQSYVYSQIEKASSQAKSKHPYQDALNKLKEAAGAVRMDLATNQLILAKTRKVRGKPA